MKRYSVKISIEQNLHPTNHKDGYTYICQAFSEFLCYFLILLCLKKVHSLKFILIKPHNALKECLKILLVLFPCCLVPVYI